MANQQQVIRIGLDQKTIGEIVAADYRMAEIFEKYGIDFCCGGQKTVRQACEERKISVERVIQEIEQRAQEMGEVLNQYDKWEPDFLADYIINQYHTYTKDMSLKLGGLTERVVKVHGEEHPETHKIAHLWYKLSGELAKHMQKEELLLFPYIKRLVEAKKERAMLKPPVFGSAYQLIQEMELEHESTGDCLAQIKVLSNGFIPPEDACNTYRVLYSHLKEFDKNTRIHVHLENNILFPKTIQLEEQIRIEKND
jgi:regulator of cell morphogenesis and NO signaling